MDRSQSQFQILIRFHNPRYHPISLDVEEHDSIYTVLCKLYQKINIPIPSTMLLPVMIFHGKELDITKSIKDYKIKHADAIYCLASMHRIPKNAIPLSQNAIQQMVQHACRPPHNLIIKSNIKPRLQVLNAKQVNGHCHMMLSDGQHYIHAMSLDQLKNFAIIDLTDFGCRIINLQLKCVVHQCKVLQQGSYIIGNPIDILGAAHMHAQFTIYVTFLGKNIALKCKNTTRVQDVKKFIYKKEQIPVKRQSLLFNGKAVKDTRTLLYYGIKKSDQLHLVDKNDSLKAAMTNVITTLENKRLSDRKTINTLRCQLIKVNNKKEKDESKILSLALQKVKDEKKILSLALQKIKNKKKILSLTNRLNSFNQLQPHVVKRFMRNPLVLIVCIRDYDVSRNLPGTQMDKTNMINLFNYQYKYKTITTKQARVKLSDLKQKIRDCKYELNTYETDDKKNSKYDGIIVVLSCHGSGNDEIITSDEKTMKVDCIKEHFNGHHTNVPSLVNAPKLFIVDACRGKNKPELTINNNNNIGNICKGKNKQHHPDKNCITINCTTKGYTTDDTSKGGYLIQAVFEILQNDKIVENCDLLRLTELVKRKVLQKTKNMNCTESTSTTFDADCYLKPNIIKII